MVRTAGRLLHSMLDSTSRRRKTYWHLGAAASAAHKLGLVGNCVQVHMQGGDLLVEFAEDDRVFMTGPVVYIGSITLAENFFA